MLGTHKRCNLRKFCSKLRKLTLKSLFGNTNKDGYANLQTLEQKLRNVMRSLYPA